MLRLRFAFPFFVALAVALAAGCGGGGGSSMPAAPTPFPGPTTAPLGPVTPASVLISGGGYSLGFQMPPVISGNTASMSAVLQTALPAGALAPQSGKRSTSIVAKPSAGGVSANGLVYLIVSTDASVEFGLAPSFVFTMPPGVAVAPGQFAYLWYWDPYQNSWVHLLGPGTVASNTVTFPSVATDVKFNKDAQYIFALVVTTAAVPTASPAPTPTPGSTPTPAPLAAYCSNYSSNASAGAVPLNITDDSGLGATLMVYVQSGNYMDNTGQFTQASPYPLPAACFSTTLGSTAQKKALNIPQGAQGRIYFAYTNATPNPNPAATPPNPFGSGGATFNPDYNDSPFPWDKIEYGIVPAGIMDTTQVDFMGLPLEMSLTSGALPHQAPGSCPTSPSSVVGVSSCGFAAIFQQMLAPAVAQYNPLAITQNFNGKLIDMRVIAPKNALSFTSFQWNLFDIPANAVLTPPCTSGNTNANGYLQCVLASYQTTPRLFTSKVPGAGAVGAGRGNISGDWYCATSDGSANFIFTDVGASAPASCASATPNPSPRLAANPFKLPISTLTYGIPPAQDTGNVSACQYNNMFSQPYGLFFVDNQTGMGAAYSTPGNLFSGSDAFALWKAIVADLNYGTSLAPGQHPVGEFAPKPLQMSSFWQDPMYNTYSNILHANFDGNLAYSLAYDDLFGWSTSVGFGAGPQVINVRINQVPAASAASAAPVPVANPASCPVIPPEIGSY